MSSIEDVCGDDQRVVGSKADDKHEAGQEVHFILFLIKR
jgi:hypothetical protein